jgi:hypothetical protein
MAEADIELVKTTGKGGAAGDTSGDDNNRDGIGGDGKVEDGNGNAGTRPSLPIGGVTLAVETIWGGITTLTIPSQPNNSNLWLAGPDGAAMVITGKDVVQKVRKP